MLFGKKEVDWLLRDKYPRFLAEPKKYLPQIRRDLRRLKNGEPLAYVIGWVDFLGCKIDLSHRPLIPRPETEFWTEQAIKRIKARCETTNARECRELRILDVFAGSGCIGIAVLKHIPGAEVWFTDNDPACLRQIRKNLELNPVRSKKSRISADARESERRTSNGMNRIPPRRCKIKHSHILKNVRMSFDYILADPPYIPSGRKSKLPLSVRKYEKPQALFGGRDGLFYIRRLLKEAKSRLKPGGELWLEFDSPQKRPIAHLAKKEGYRAAFHKDQFKKSRYVILVKR